MEPCNLCRTLTNVEELSSGLCCVCTPWWPTVKSKVELTPAWQRDAEECDLTAKTMRWIKENEIQPDDRGWARVLSKIMNDVEVSDLLVFCGYSLDDHMKSHITGKINLLRRYVVNFTSVP